MKIKCDDCLYKFRLWVLYPCSCCKEIDIFSSYDSKYKKYNNKCANCIYEDYERDNRFLDGKRWMIKKQRE